MSDTKTSEPAQEEEEEVCEYYEIRYETRPAAFGLAICDRTLKPYICLVPEALSAARKGVRVGSLMTHVNGIPLEGKLPTEWRPLLGVATAPIVIKFEYNPKETLRTVSASSCENWTEWEKVMRAKNSIQPTKMVTLSDALVIRNAPGDQSHVVAEVKFGEIVYGTEIQGPFVKVMQNGRVLGWALKTEGLRHNLRDLQEDEVGEVRADVPSFARQLSERAQNMAGGVEGLYFAKHGTNMPVYWRTVHEAVLEAIRSRTDGGTMHVEKGVATLIMSYAVVETVPAEMWNFSLENCGTGAFSTAEELLLNGRPTVLVFLHERATPMSLLNLVLQSVSLEESCPYRPLPVLDFAIVLISGAKASHYKTEPGPSPDDFDDEETLQTFQNDAWKLPRNVVYRTEFSQLGFFYPNPEDCSCPHHATRLLVVNENGMLSYTGNGTEGNTLWVQALEILRNNLDLQS